MSKSNIEWTEETWNIITGCTKHSEGCKNCYAEKMHKRLTAMKQEKYKEPFENVVFHSKELGRVFGKNKMIFVNSMSDTFHKDITDLEIGYILTACQIQTMNTFQILTKRAERLPNFEYPKNVWLGVTVENIEHKDRIEYLKQTDATIKFLSCEPLLGDLGELNLKDIDWVIAGGESGPHARATNPEWVRNIQRQCEEQGVAFFFKQWGEWAPCKINHIHEIPAGLNIMFKNTSVGKSESAPLDIMQRVGKKKAGSLLDGVEYKEYPKEVPV